MSMFPRIALGCTAAFGLLIGTSVSASGSVGSAVPLYLPADTVTIPLEPVNESAASGVATMQETEEGQTTLEVELRGVGADADQFVAFLVSGTCEQPGEVRAALGIVDADAAGEARGAFLLGDPIDDVLAVPTTVQVQADAPDAVPVACGQLAPLGDDPFAEPTTTPLPDPIPADDAADQVEDVLDHEAEAEDEAEAEEIEELEIDDVEIEEVDAEDGQPADQA
jgi:hypothetical protein